MPTARVPTAVTVDVRNVHFAISAALSAAVRWDWVRQGEPCGRREDAEPAPAAAEPADRQAGRPNRDGILGTRRELGTLVWLVMVTGLRRAELLALKWLDVDPGRRQADGSP